MKKYILLIKEDSEYEGFCRFRYLLFTSYIELQKHLLKFKEYNNYEVYEETKIKRDTTLIPKRKIF